jgi:hypothetical protein
MPLMRKNSLPREAEKTGRVIMTTRIHNNAINDKNCFYMKK